MFISSSEIGHLTSCYLCMTWLNWSLSFILDYGLIHTWFPHTTHKSNIQWIPILFVWLYMFKCDVCVLNHMWIKLKRFLNILFVFGSVFITLCFLVLYLLCFSMFQACFCVEKQGSESFMSSLRLSYE